MKFKVIEFYYNGYDFEVPNALEDKLNELGVDKVFQVVRVYHYDKMHKFYIITKEKVK